MITSGLCVASPSISTYAGYLAHSVVGLEKPHDLGVELIDIIGDIIMFCCFDGTAGDNNATCVDYSEDGVCAAHVDADYIRFTHGCA